jgi:hypothetical protein
MVQKTSHSYLGVQEVSSSGGRTPSGFHLTGPINDNHLRAPPPGGSVEQKFKRVAPASVPAPRQAPTPRFWRSFPTSARFDQRGEVVSPLTSSSP